MKRLIINNFGAIKKADIVIKKYNIYIGDTSSGKSTIAKLIAIVNSSAFMRIDNGTSIYYKFFVELLKCYNIDFQFDDSTSIRYENEDLYWEVKKDIFITNSRDDTRPETGLDRYDYFSMSRKPLFENWIEPKIENIRDRDDNSKLVFSEKISRYKTPVIYIPVERLLMSLYTNSIFSFLRAELNIPDCIKVFGTLYEEAKVQNSRIAIDILNIMVSFSGQGDTISLKDDNKVIKFPQASSGMQSIIPLWTVFNHRAKIDKEQIFIIEEPEINLFPTTQLNLIHWIMSEIKPSQGNIVITTHSPYILTTIDNLIFANEIYKKSKSNPEIIDKLENLIPSTAMINFDEVSSYFFPITGEVKNIVDNELKTIGAEYIDKASDISSELFDELCDLENKYLS